MTPAQIETIYEVLATRLDAVGQKNQSLFLAKLVLLLARDIGDAAIVHQRIREAEMDLDV